MDKSIIILIIGPSYIGKSFFSEKISSEIKGLKLIKFSNYRLNLKSIKSIKDKFNIINAGIKVFKIWTKALYLTFKISWRCRFFRYAFINFYIFERYKSLNQALYDEELIKKLMDGVRSPRNFLEYKKTKKFMLRLISDITSTYLSNIGAQNKLVVICDCSYKICKQRAKERHDDAGIQFQEKIFRNRLTLERRIYREYLKFLQEKNILCLYQKLDIYDSTKLKAYIE